MVWPFTSSSESSNPPATEKSSDPYSKLDPSLKKFLERESPGRYDASAPPVREPTSLEKFHQAPPPAEQDQQQSSTSSSSTSSSSPSAAPPQSLFPDGRYAHLWKTYRSRAEVEGEHKTDQEKLNTLMQHHKDKKDMVSKAALENCAAINATLDECFRKPNLSQRMVMCRTETRALNRCLDMNKRFLKALGYLSASNGTVAQEEAIQMHADKLYTRMLEQEQRMEQAKAEGRELEPDEVPEPLFKDSRKEATAILDMLTDEGKEKLKERTKGMTPAEVEIEERCFAAELEAGLKTMQKVDKHRGEVRKARLERIESGKARTMDRFQAWFGW